MPFAWAAGISAGASLLGSVFGGNAAQGAADTQTAAADRAAAATKAQYDQTRADLAPYRDAGTSALAALQTRLPELATGYGKTFAWNPTMAQIEATPGYQFTRDQGLKAVQNSASAKGLGVSGAALRGAADYATGLANNTWKDLYNTDLTTYNTGFNVDTANKTNAFNKLLGVAGIGQSSAAQTGYLGNAATQNANTFLTSGANAQAGGQVGASNALTSGLNGVSNSAMNYAMLSPILNRLSGGGGSAGNGNAVSNAVSNAYSGGWLG